MMDLRVKNARCFIHCLLAFQEASFGVHLLDEITATPERENSQ